ncbi:MAG TPA: helical backbone metal receptor [Vicinamibacterales bacterium]|nr:helical backbone metal receptor [Vicinamibacterales bacterium]
MRLRLRPAAHVFALAVLLLAAFAVLAGSMPQPRSARTATRIVSLIPAVTEMLFAIGAGPQVVAVSSFDEYPPEVLKLPRVGALLDPDVERILSLRPDLVVVYESQVDLRKQLDRASIPVFVYKHAGLADVTETIRQVGETIGRGKNAASVIADIQAHLNRIRAQVGGRAKPRTLLVFGRDAMTLRGIYASGGVGFLHDMLGAAGGENVFADVKQQSVQATAELILARKPDVIIEFRPGKIAPDREAQEIAAWKALAAVPAVRSNRIVLLTDQRTVVPGPRVAEGTELLARAIHPDAFAK